MILEGLFDLVFQFLYRTVIYIVVEVFAHILFLFFRFCCNQVVHIDQVSTNAAKRSY